MTGSTEKNQAMAALLAYWQSCGVTALAGEVSAKSAWREESRPENIAPVEALPKSAPPLPAAKPPPIQPAVPPPPPSPPPLSPLASLQEKEAFFADFAARVSKCQRCALSQTRRQTVFGVGSLAAPVVFVGEGPGADEDRLGEPFVGAAGKLLDRMLQAVAMDRSSVYIANVVKCRPPGNRNPQPGEIAACQGFLFDQLAIIAPKAIFALGRFAIQTLLGEIQGIERVRGRVHHWRDIPVIASYHPAYYLRAALRKRAGWEDLQLLLETLEKRG